MCLVCDAKKLSGDSRKTASEINVGLLEMVTKAVDSLSDVLQMVARAHDEKRPMNSGEMAVCDEAAKLVMANEPVSKDKIAQLLAAALGIDVAIVVTVLDDRSDGTDPIPGATRH